MFIVLILTVNLTRCRVFLLFADYWHVAGCFISYIFFHIPPIYFLIYHPFPLIRYYILYFILISAGGNTPKHNIYTFQAVYSTITTIYSIVTTIVHAMQQYYYYTIWEYHGIILTSKARIACGLATAQSFARKTERPAQAVLWKLNTFQAVFSTNIQTAAKRS